MIGKFPTINVRIVGVIEKGDDSDILHFADKGIVQRRLVSGNRHNFAAGESETRQEKDQNEEFR
jgi:hypothetical protein